MLLLAVAKYFVINMLQSFNSEISEDSQLTEFLYIKNRYLLSNLANVFSLLLVGNCIDNITDHKALVTVCNLSLAAVYLLFGAMVLIDDKFVNILNSGLG